jgi:hypothetical protein
MMFQLEKSREPSSVDFAYILWIFVIWMFVLNLIIWNIEYKQACIHALTSWPCYWNLSGMKICL